MPDVNTLVDIAQTAPLVFVFYLLWKAGVIKIGKNGKNNGYQGQIDDLKSHADVANKEMGAIREHIAQIESDVSFIRGVISKK